MTNADELRQEFHELLSNALEDFKQGRRDPEIQHEFLCFILKYRGLSQEWEELADKGDSIRCFWKDRLLEEIHVVKDQAASETMLFKTQGAESIEIRMVHVPEGSFLMGNDDFGPIHWVKIEKPFQIAEAPVTQKLYTSVIGENPSNFKGDDAPVEQVSWFDAVRFCNELSKRMSFEPAYKIEGTSVEWLPGSNGYRLPTEAEWEYACRAGSTTRFASGDLETDLDEMGWWAGNSGGRTHPVAQKKPNAWGVFDMHGNVWEWIWDRYGAPLGIPTNSPSGPSYGADRVVRGGSSFNDARVCRSAIRGSPPDDCANGLGFRLSRS